SAPAGAATVHGGEANIVLPDLSGVSAVGGVSGRLLLLIGVGVCVLGLCFGLITYMNLRKLPVHRAMAEVADLIYETCKAYLVKQGRFLLVLWAFITAVIVVYYKFLVGF
ncbi:sodium/proton-translocating pyrophosphatase, partial [Klebsiella quasipneumoniae]|nr:sodium/proton-translocating pyrophosphatase [Klebsiella quasipneumoniae]